MKLTNLHDVLVHQLRDILYAEKKITKALPKMAKAATNPDLRSAFNEHLEETRTHVERVEKALESLGVAARSVKCEAIDGIIEEGEELLEGDHDKDALDAALIAAAQRVEHYEIAVYGCACAFAKRLGENDVAEILGETLAEEHGADKLLTSLAEGEINTAAVNGNTETRRR